MTPYRDFSPEEIPYEGPSQEEIPYEDPNQESTKNHEKGRILLPLVFLNKFLFNFLRGSFVFPLYLILFQTQQYELLKIALIWGITFNFFFSYLPQTIKHFLLSIWVLILTFSLFSGLLLFFPQFTNGLPIVIIVFPILSRIYNSNLSFIIGASLSDKQKKQSYKWQSPLFYLAYATGIYITGLGFTRFGDLASYLPLYAIHSVAIMIITLVVYLMAHLKHQKKSSFNKWKEWGNFFREFRHYGWFDGFILITSSCVSIIHSWVKVIFLLLPLYVFSNEETLASIIPNLTLIYLIGGILGYIFRKTIRKIIPTSIMYILCQIIFLIGLYILKTWADAMIVYIILGIQLALALSTPSFYEIYFGKMKSNEFAIYHFNNTLSTIGRIGVIFIMVPFLVNNIFVEVITIGFGMQIALIAIAFLIIILPKR